ncbi:MAG TPA: DUF3095 family protein, partial [Mariprofundaceae bacterium]|nr:DUF3095 family protein [Mariprofundaceae bacterium]
MSNNESDTAARGPLNTETFYSDLPGFSVFNEFTDAQCYTALPEDWFVVITDVQGSTKAIEEGRYKQVNALGAASIIALLNAVAPLRVPYVFGGDGATICFPPSKRQAVESALVATRLMAEESFNLSLRIGIVPMQEILDRGHQVKVARFQPTPHYQQAMFMGDGLGYAESLVKAVMPDNPFLVDDADIVPRASFEGFECRWNEIPSPHEEVVAILVQATTCDAQVQEKTFDEIFTAFTNIYGNENSHHPVREKQMKLAVSLRTLASEIGVRTTFLSFLQRWIYIALLEIKIFTGKWFMYKNIQTDVTDWGSYKKNFIANTDYRKFDEALRMV